MRQKGRKKSQILNGGFSLGLRYEICEMRKYGMGIS